MKKLLQHPFVRGGAIFSIASFVVSALNYGFNLIVARFFPLATYGEYITALSYLMIFSVPFGAINITLIQKIGQRPLEERLAFVLSLEAWMHQKIIKYRYLWLLIGSLIFWILRVKSGLSLGSLTAVFALSALGALSLIYLASLQAFKQFLGAGVVGISSSLFKLLGLAVILVVWPKLEGVYLLFFTSGVISLFFSRWLIKRVKSGQAKVKAQFKHPTAYLTKASFLIPIITTFGLVGMLSVDMILVKKFFVADDVGLYAALSLLSKIILYLAGPLGAVAFTFFTGNESQHERKKVLGITTLLLLLAGGVSLLGYWLLPELIIGLIFGAKFSSIAPYVWLTAVYGLLYSLANLFAQYWISRSHWLGSVSIFVLALQTLAIIVWHQSFGQVMMVNIGVSAILLFIYVAGLVRLKE